MKQIPIADRIRSAFLDGERELHFYELARRVFPREQYPNAFRYQSNGGPPGCCMSLMKAINRMGLHIRYTGHGGERFVSKPALEKD